MFGSIMEPVREANHIPSEIRLSKVPYLKHFCFELHSGDMVYNPESLFRLREAVGEEICCNHDAGNIEWHGIDTPAAIHELNETIRHVHAKGSKIYRRHSAISGTTESHVGSQE
jgi:sugar phosphate isomerase/epimerase